MSEIHAPAIGNPPDHPRALIGGRRDISARTAWLLLVLAMLVAVAVRLPGVFWLVGLGATVDQSFNVDANRFIIAALNFQNPDFKPDGYPLFMTTQLYVLAKLLGLVGADGINYAILLRLISLAYAILTLPLAFLFCRVLGFSKLVSVMSAWLLSLAPMHVLLSHAGTPDISILCIFYLTMLSAVLYRQRGNEWFFYLVCALTGIALADKFYLPALVPLGLILVTGPLRDLAQRSFLAACIAIACFAIGSFFNYTPWDFGRLLAMIAYDNLIVSDGHTPLQQFGLYAWDSIAAAGVVTTILALPMMMGMLVGLGQRPRITRPLATAWRWLRSPSALIALPLVAHALLIVVAQVHGMRHVLVLVPVLCVLAAMALERLGALLNLSARQGAVAWLGLAFVLSVNAVLTMRIYATDIRGPLLTFLAESRPAADLTTLNTYSQLRGSRLVNEQNLSDLMATCDLEYQRYFQDTDADQIFHAYGGQERLHFYRDLFAGRTDFVLLHSVRRSRFSLEDRLAAFGVLPELGTFAPGECRVYERPVPSPVAPPLGLRPSS